jgi:Protein of unknown function (DUF429)
MSGLYLGYDPGGGGAHGVAAIDARPAACATVRTAEDALDWFRERCRDQEPKALGVDTLTLWSTGPAGWRPADRALRTAYPDVATSVTAPNALYGAMLINGIAVALALRNAFERLRITETHPKVLYFTLAQSVYDFVQRRDQMVQNLVDWVALAMWATTMRGTRLRRRSQHANGIRENGRTTFTNCRAMPARR